ncbi:MAG TPA: methyltransferase domain-containing protein [Candidatus Edwardsbacteria bacterium]|nr:methyltransferase domain-containing protein [Candidatus Edwardsbacteria bacterium]
MIRQSAIYFANRLLCRFKRGQLIRTPVGVVKVNAGSALDVAPGWINIDGSLNMAFAGWPRWWLRQLYAVSGWQPFYTRDHYVATLALQPFVHHNAAYGLPLPAGTADFIYTSYLLTELFADDAARFLESCHRALKPGGVLRVAVLDLEFVLGLYRRGAKADALRLLFPGDGGAMFTRRNSMYDAELLAAALRQAGFSDVVRRGPGEGRVPDLDRLDNRPERTLYVEATKSCRPAGGGT